MEKNHDTAIGELAGAFKIHADITARQYESAAASRGRIFDELRDLAENTLDMKHHVARIDERLKKVEPVVDDMRRWRERSIGFIFAVSAVSTVFMSGLALAWRKVFTVLGM